MNFITTQVGKLEDVCAAQGLKQTCQFGAKNLTFLWSGCGKVFPDAQKSLRYYVPFTDKFFCFVHLVSSPSHITPLSLHA